MNFSLMCIPMDVLLWNKNEMRQIRLNCPEI